MMRSYTVGAYLPRRSHLHDGFSSCIGRISAYMDGRPPGCDVIKTPYSRFDDADRKTNREIR
jgi:hypothetical protein